MVGAGEGGNDAGPSDPWLRNHMTTLGGWRSLSDSLPSQLPDTLAAPRPGGRREPSSPRTDTDNDAPWHSPTPTGTA